MSHRSRHRAADEEPRHIVQRKVLGIRELSSTAYVLRIERGDLRFEPGQYIMVGARGEGALREYSVYSSPADDHLEILVKVVEGGVVSPRLKRLQPGDRVEVAGPFGEFTIDASALQRAPFYFVATGTGISPFHSFVRSYPKIDYRIIHGIRSTSERYETATYDDARYLDCVSREAGGSYRGRVTDYLREVPPRPDGLFYLCGNCDMIYELFGRLVDQGVEEDRIFAEVYF